MDFVVVGLGLGTLAILTGVLMIAWVAGRWERAAARAATPGDAAYDQAVAAARRGAGQALIAAGVAVLIATIAALAGSLDDQTGAFFVTTTITVATLGLFVWAYFHRARNPLPARRHQRPAATEGTEQAEAALRTIPREPLAPPSPRFTDGPLDDDQEPPGLLEGDIEPVPPEHVAAAASIDSRGEAPSDARALSMEKRPANDERVTVDEANERDTAAVQPLPAAANVEEVEGDDVPEREPEEIDSSLNGGHDAPRVLYVDDWKVRRDRKT